MKTPEAPVVLKPGLYGPDRQGQEKGAERVTMMLIPDYGSC